MPLQRFYRPAAAMPLVSLATQAAALHQPMRLAGSKAIPIDEGDTEEKQKAAAEAAAAAAAAPPDFLHEGMPTGLNSEAHEKAREALLQEILSRDKEIFELKRQHELSMLRVEQHQKRMLKDQEDRGMYYEQNVNVHTFDTISVGLYSQRSTLYHTLNAERLRNFKILLTVLTTVIVCTYIYYRYMINPDWQYVEEPIRLIGSRVNAVREERWRRMSDEEQLAELQRLEKSYNENKIESRKQP